MTRPFRPITLVFLLACLLPAQPSPETRTIRMNSADKADPATLSLRKGDLTWYIEWRQEQKRDTEIQFGALSPCIEGPVIKAIHGHGLCTLKQKVCVDVNADLITHECTFPYQTAGGEAAIRIAEGYQPPTPLNWKGEFQRKNESPVRPGSFQEPGDVIVVRTHRVTFGPSTEVRIGDKPAIIAGILSLNLAEVIVPTLREDPSGKDLPYGVDVSSAGTSERAGNIRIRTAASRILTVVLDGRTPRIIKTEPYLFPAPRCVEDQLARGIVLYDVLVRRNGADSKVGCGAVRDFQNAEIFSAAGPRHERSGGQPFTIVVPHARGERITFRAGDGDGIALLGLGPSPTFDDLLVPY